MECLNLFDVVALTVDIPDSNLFRGHVGTIVEVFADGEAFEVEFVDREGRTYGLVAVEAKNLLALHYEPEQIVA